MFIHWKSIGQKRDFFFLLERKNNSILPPCTNYSSPFIYPEERKFVVMPKYFSKMYGYFQIQETRSKKDGELRDKFVPYVEQESGSCPLDWTIPYTQMLIWYFSNNFDIYYYVGKLPKQHFSVWLVSNQGDEILFLLKFNEVRISEWNLNVLILTNSLNIPQATSLRFSMIKFFFY